MDASYLIHALREFVKERDWGQFHTPSNLAKSISIESAELLESFQWTDEVDIERIKDELADVLTYCILLADKIGVDPDVIVMEKLEKSAKKYPVEKSKGNSTKYDRL